MGDEMNVEIKRMFLSDLEEIHHILVSDFDDFWNYSLLKDELENSNSKYIVAKSNNEIIGFAGIKIFIDTADIMNIVVKKSWRNHGVGSLLLDNLIFLCKNLHLNSLSLEVNSKNISAINLYKKFEFNQIHIRKNYYKDSDAIIMLKEL